MKTFTDTAGHTWTIQMTLNAVKRVKARLDVDLLALEVGDPPLLTRLALEVILLCDVIYVLIQPQADELKVSDEQFGAALGGEVIHAAQTAFYEELVDFFQGLGRNDLAKAVNAQRRVIDLTVERIGTKLDGINLEKVLTEAEETIFGSPSTNSLES